MVWQDSHHDLPVKTSSINQTTKVWADTLSYSAKLWAHIFVLRLRQGSSQYGAAIYESSSELLYTKGRSELPWYWFIYDTKVDAIHMKWTPRILNHSQSLNLGGILHDPRNEWHALSQYLEWLAQLIFCVRGGVRRRERPESVAESILQV